MLHSPPVFESDLDTVDHDFYDYAVHAPDDDFYYVSWEDPIYDVFQEYDYSGKYSRQYTSLLHRFFAYLGLESSEFI